MPEEATQEQANAYNMACANVLSVALGLVLKDGTAQEAVNAAAQDAYASAKIVYTGSTPEDVLRVTLDNTLSQVDTGIPRDYQRKVKPIVLEAFKKVTI